MSKRDRPQPKEPEASVSAPALSVEAATSAEVERPATAVPAPTKKPIPKAQRFRVWSIGGLRCNGVKFAADEELPMDERELDSLGLIASGVAVAIED